MTKTKKVTIEFEVPDFENMTQGELIEFALDDMLDIDKDLSLMDPEEGAKEIYVKLISKNFFAKEIERLNSESECEVSSKLC